MSIIINTINDTGYQGVTVKKIAEHKSYEVILITLQKGSRIPEHVANRDAQLVMLEGKIRFHIEDSVHNLNKHEVLCFGKEIKHRVEAVRDSKFMLVK